MRWQGSMVPKRVERWAGVGRGLWVERIVPVGGGEWQRSRDGGGLWDGGWGWGTEVGRGTEVGYEGPEREGGRVKGRGGWRVVAVP